YGFGPGAAFYLDDVRSTRYRSVTGWIKKVQAKESTISSNETLDRDLAAREAVMLGLRQIAGLDTKSYEARFEMSVRDLAVDAYDEFLETGLLELSEGHLRLSYEGRFLADTVVAEFL
ncbi:MAG: coproporphyrinogen III oxidase, partial [Planctomicrobium sp.]|nr:coproporphyrinogen III oxidase [Planctomicrobium sp.]